jgi:lipopolysaccharide transport protein LptA
MFMGSTSHNPGGAVLLLASFALASAGQGVIPVAHAGKAPPLVKPPRLVKPSGPINLHASSTSFDLRTQHALLRKVVIVQGDLTLTADRAEATGLNFKDSRWTFTSNVHIDSTLEGKLSSDSATVQFRDERMQSAVVTGSPATFEQTSSTTGVLARGHADSIVYTVANSTVRLTGDAWLKYGDNEITGPVLVYDISSQRLEGASAAEHGEHGERVHITILPRPGKGKNGTKPPAAAPGRTP